MGFPVDVAVVLGFSIVIVSLIWRIWLVVLWRPYALTRYFGKQGVMGPSYSLVSGSLHEIKTLSVAAKKKAMDVNSHDITHRVLPHYHKWSSLYGETFLYWYGTEPRICISEAELVKQILSNKFGFYQKTKIRPSLQTLVGNSIGRANGQQWARRRRILNPAFTLDKLKVMVKRMSECTISMVEEWTSKVMEAEEKFKIIDVNGEFQELTADIISHTAFGSSFAQGKEAFHAQEQLKHHCVASSTNVYIPGTQYLPTPSNLKTWELDRKIRKTLKGIIERRLKDECHGDDVLGIMLEAARGNKNNNTKNSGGEMKMKEIIEECKILFFAGHETTANLLTWTMFLLSQHKEWQDQLRQEVLHTCGTQNILDADMLSKLKLVNMVLLETLRLYSPVIQLVRETSEDMKLGKLMIPKNTRVTIPVVKIHRNKEYWGEDAGEFNPWRFKNGVSNAATHPNALIAFSIGPRVCIGQNFAMLEAKTVLALILQRFRFSLSPHYIHAPANNLTLQPQYGMPIILQPLI